LQGKGLRYGFGWVRCPACRTTQSVELRSLTGEQTAPINLNLSLGGSDKTAVEMDGGTKLNVRVTSDNKIQLKFQAKQYVGEFFHYTNDLYLIYKSGHLARLACSKS
jgi:hypothetical protein